MWNRNNKMGYHEFEMQVLPSGKRARVLVWRDVNGKES